MKKTKKKIKRHIDETRKLNVFMCCDVDEIVRLCKKLERIY